MTIADHILFAFLAFALPLFAVFRVRKQVAHIPQITEIKIRIYWANGLILLAGALVIVVLWVATDRSFPELGFRWPSTAYFHEWFLLVMFFLLMYLFDGFMSWNEAEEHPAAGILPANWQEFAHFGSIVSLSAAIGEEIIFRGFLVTYLLNLFAGETYAVAAAIIISSLIFGIGHAYQGWRALLKITVLSMLFAWLYILTESLVLVIALHFFVDFVSGLIAMLKFRSDQRIDRAIRIE